MDLLVDRISCVGGQGMQRVLSSNEFEESRICLEILMEDILLDLCFEVSPRLLLSLLIHHRFIGKRRQAFVSDPFSQQVLI